MLRHKRESSKQRLAKLMKEDPPFLFTRHVGDNIGKGLFTNSVIKKGEYIGEYKGRLLTSQEVEEVDDDTYLYIFKHNDILHGINAISLEESGILRFGNDEWRNPSARMEKVTFHGRPHLFLKAIKDIPAGAEIRYDYNGPNAPWRQTKKGQGSEQTEGATSNDTTTDAESHKGDLHLEIMKSLNVDKPDHQLCLELLDRINCEDIINNKQSEIVSTLKKISLYKVDSAVAAKAKWIYIELKRLFQACPSEQETSLSKELLYEDLTEVGLSNLEEPMSPDAVPTMTVEVEKNPSIGESKVKPSEEREAEYNDEEEDMIESDTDKSSEDGECTVGDLFLEKMEDEYDNEKELGKERENNMSSANSKTDDSDQLPKKMEDEYDNEKERDTDKSSENDESEESSWSPGESEGGSEEEYDDDQQDEIDRKTYKSSFNAQCTTAKDKVVEKELHADNSQTADCSTEFPNVTIPLHEKSEGGKRKYDKINCCYYCEEMKLGKMRRHLSAKHKKEAEVARLLSKPPVEASLGFEKLRLLGDFQHNLGVLERKKGELKVLRRPIKKKTVEDYLPCINCYGLMDKREMWAHVKLCKHKDTKHENVHTNKSIIAQCRMLMTGATCSSTGMDGEPSKIRNVRDKVVSNMRDRAFSKAKSVVEKDNLILLFGGSLLERKGDTRRNEISQKMRQLARLVEKVRELENHSTLSLNDCISPGKFDVVISATKELCVVQAERTYSGINKTKSPSLGLHLGHSLLKCCHLKRGQAIRSGDQKQQAEANAFKELFEAEWTDVVSGPALRILKERSYQKTERLPSTSDLKKLNEYTETCIASSKDAVLSRPGPVVWRQLANAIFVAVTVFNKRRGGEVARIRLNSFRKRALRDASHINTDLKETLSVVERKLVERFDCMSLPGKRGRKVPLLLKDHWVSAMEVLDARREECQVKATNDFFFAVPNKQTHINAWQTLHNFVVKADCAFPWDISTTKLRKYTATLLQVLSLNDGELDWLSNHLGHELSIHKEVYRLHSSIIEAGKVSKLLLALEAGTVHNLKGKSLDDIHIDEITFGPLGNDDEDEEEEEEVLHEEPRTKKRKQLGQSELPCRVMDEEVQEQEISHEEPHSGVFKRRRWTDNEKQVFFDGLKPYIVNKTMPPRKELEKMQKRVPGRSLPQIRARVHNIIKEKQSY